MHSLKVFGVATFALLPIAVGATSTDCYNTGRKYGDNVRNAMLKDELLDPVCNNLAGSYASSESRHTCMEVEGAKFDFTLRCSNSDGRNIDAQECKDGMRKQLNCRRGGHTQYDNWLYK